MWAKFLADVQATPDVAAAFYLFLAWVLSIPLGELTHLIAKIPVDKINSKNTPYALAFLGWAACWFTAHYIPGIDRGMLTMSVVGGALLSNKTREDVTVPVMEASGILKPKEEMP